PCARSLAEHVTSHNLANSKSMRIMASHRSETNSRLLHPTRRRDCIPHRPICSYPERSAYVSSEIFVAGREEVADFRSEKEYTHFVPTSNVGFVLEKYKIYTRCTLGVKPNTTLAAKKVKSIVSIRDS